MSSSTSGSKVWRQRPDSPSLGLSPQEKRELVALLAERARRLEQNLLKQYQPYPKQLEFHAAGLTHRERLLMAANQVGKTVAGGSEVAMHLTGRYPDWWVGRRWNRPVVGWAAGVTNESTRDNPQRILMGRLGLQGTGAIPGECILDTTSARGTPGLLDTVWIRHATGGMSVFQFKSYERGREKWQGETLDFVWYDEEPPEDIYSEGLTRTNATGGMTLVTFTPLLGISTVVKRFLMPEQGDVAAEQRHVTMMTIDDAEHYSPQERAIIAASYEEHEREARTKGVPALGEGRVFPVSEESIAIDPLPIPVHWARICGIDFGWDHPAAAAWLAWDRDADVVYVYDGWRQSRATPAVHAAAILARGAWIPVAWPADGLDTRAGEGVAFKEQYVTAGCNMLPEFAQMDLPDLTEQHTVTMRTSVEASVIEMLQRMQTGRWKVFRHLRPWFEEFGLYHRKDGKIVKLIDDLLCASRYAHMMLRFAKPQPRYKGGAAAPKKSWRTV